MNYQVTVDEYKELVNKMWSGEMTIKELDKYEIILPFEPNHTNKFINELIDNYCVDAQQETHRNLFTGSCRDYDNLGQRLINNSFKLMYEWSEMPYRYVYVSEQDKTIVTYCEGDISFSLCHTEHDYNKEYDICKRFYEEN